MNIQDIESDASSPSWMKKHLCEEPQDPTTQTHQAEGQSRCQNYRPFDSHKMINLEEDFLEEEDSLVEEDSPEEEDSLEGEDTQAAEECHPEGHQEALGGHRQCLYHKPIKEN